MILCRTARIASLAWDFIDKRDIDKHIVAGIILWCTIEITRWAMHYAANGDRPGLEVAAIIGAVVGPWAILQGAIAKWYFDVRSSE